MKKIIIFILLSLMLVSSAFAQTSLNFTQEKKDNLESNKEAISNFRMKDIRQDPFPANPGELIDVYMAIDNIGGDVINPRFEFNLKYPFSLDPSIDNSNFPTLKSGEKLTLHYKLKIDKNAIPGNYEVEFRAYTDNGIYYPYFFSIKIDDVTSNFDVAMQQVSKEGLSIAISNIGKNSANSITVKIPEQESFELIGSPSYIVGNLNSGDYTLLNVLVKPKLNYEDNQEKILNLQIDYTDTIGNRRTINKEIPIIMTQQIKKGFSDLTGYTTKIDTSEQINNNYKVFIYTSLILAVILIAVIIYYKRKINKANEED